MSFVLKEDLSILRCLHCQGELHEHEPGKVQCVVCHHDVSCQDGILFFSSVSDEIHPSTITKTDTDPNQWTRWRKLNYDFYEEEIKKISNPQTLIDLGAGRRQFRKLFDFIPKTIAIDFYPYPGMDLVIDLTRPFPVTDNLADVIILSNVLEHISEPYDLLKECYRILKPQGRLLLTVPFFIKIHQAPYDFYRYTSYGLKYLLKRAGFQRTYIIPLGNPLDVYRDVRDFPIKHLRKKCSLFWFKCEMKLLKFINDLVFKRFTHYQEWFEPDEGYGYFQGYGAVVKKD